MAVAVCTKAFAACRHAPPRVLLVDDNVDAAESLAELLRLWDADVRTAHDGVRALEVAAEFRPQLVVLDIGLPTIDGYEVARRLRCDLGLGDARLVALSGYVEDGGEQRSRDAGIDDYLVKPIDLEEIRALLP